MAIKLKRAGKRYIVWLKDWRSWLIVSLHDSQVRRMRSLTSARLCSGVRGEMDPRDEPEDDKRLGLVSGFYPSAWLLFLTRAAST